MRIGIGYDVHRLVEGRKLIIGGVEIPYEKGLLGHSDADVLLHAVADAFLGAAAMGDIGKLYPDNDPKYNNIDSKILLKDTVDRVYGAGYALCNLDCIIVAQNPKMRPYIDQMRQNIAQICNVDISRISVKATTEEGLSFTGEGLGISAKAAVLLEEK